MTTLTDTQVITASGGLVELGYSQITGDVTVDNATAGTGKEVIAPLTVVCDGGPVLVEFFSAGVTPNSTSGDAIITSLFMDGAEKSRVWGYKVAQAANASNEPQHLSYRTTPSAGSHTFSVRAYVSSAARTGTVGAGSATTGTAPAFLRVSKIVQATQWPAVTTGTIICTSSTRPASPFQGQRIYETDSKKEWVYDGAAWYSPGVQAVAKVTTAQNSIGTSFTDLTSLTVTFTAVSSRMYKTTMYLPVVNKNTAAGYVSAIIADSSNNQYQMWQQYLGGANHQSGMTLVVYESGLSGSTTRKGRLRAHADTVNNGADTTYPSLIMVEDIGPA